VPDKINQLVLDALTRAAATAAGVPWHGSKNAPGLFPGTVLGKQAAQRCRDDGLLASVAPTADAAPDGGGTTVRTRRPVELCAITEKGLQHLLGQVSPRPVLEDFVRVLEARAAQAGELSEQARRTGEDVAALKANVDRVLQLVCRQHADAGTPNGGGELNDLYRRFIQNGTSDSALTQPNADGPVLERLAAWAKSGAMEDCPLPELFRHAQGPSPGLTIGRFHDTLRRLHDGGRVYLHPWTGPLYDIPEPSYALLVGHEVAYYASLREETPSPQPSGSGAA
jgi:hypothetical protein